MMSQAGVLPGPGLTGKAKAWCSRDTRDANIWAMMRFMGVSSSNHLQRLEDWQLLVDKRLRFGLRLRGLNNSDCSTKLSGSHSRTDRSNQRQFSCYGTISCRVYPCID
jgi:hypothetical protein